MRPVGLRKGEQMKLLYSLVAVVALSACGGGGDSAPAAPRIFNVVYEVSGTGVRTASATYRTPAGATQQDKVTILNSPAKLPGIIGSYSAREGDFLYISAQNDSSAGAISVSILVDGKSIGGASSSAPFGIATFSKACC